jgi:hypothetical protein
MPRNKAGHDDFIFSVSHGMLSDAGLRTYRALTSMARQNLIALLVPPI